MTEGETIETNFPVSTSSDGEPSDFTGIMSLIVSTENSLSTIIGVLVRITEIERKYFVVNQLLLTQMPNIGRNLLVDEFIEGRSDVVDRDSIVSHSEDTIESAKGERKTRLLCGFSEELILDLHSSEVQGIGADESRKTATTISNLEIGAITLIR